MKGELNERNRQTQSFRSTNGDEWLSKSFDRSSTDPQAHGSTGKWEKSTGIIKCEMASMAHQKKQIKLSDRKIGKWQI